MPKNHCRIRPWILISVLVMESKGGRCVLSSKWDLFHYCLCLWFVFALSLLVYFGIWVKDFFCFDFIGVLTFQVDYQGNVTLLTQGIYMTKCQIDVTHYPFDPQVRYSLTIQEWINPPDFQRCSLKFASWTTEITRLNLSIGENISLPLHWSCVHISYVKRAHNVLSLLSQSQWSNLRSEIWHPTSTISNVRHPIQSNLSLQSQNTCRCSSLQVFPGVFYMMIKMNC